MRFQQNDKQTNKTMHSNMVCVVYHCYNRFEVYACVFKPDARFGLEIDIGGIRLCVRFWRSRIGAEAPSTECMIRH